jgi:O-methyltransferase
MRVHPVYSTEETLMFTYNMSKQLIQQGIKGCFIECGVAAGSQIGAMQQALIDSNDHRIIYGFDSFEGIPFATKEDTEQPGIGEIDKGKLGLLETTGVSSHSIEDVISNFRLWNLHISNLRLVKGWFQDTIKKESENIEEIAMLRLDGDLYESTKIPLQYLYNKVSKGGIIIIDDWNLEGCKKAIREVIHHKKIKMYNEIAYVIK